MTVNNGEAITSLPIVCNMNAFNAEQQARYTQITALLRDAVREVAEVEDGFTFSFPADASLCLAAMEFATLERLCCPFLRFRLELAPGGGPFTLTLSGPPGTKEILAEFLRS
jgi:hypothetical protein